MFQLTDLAIYGVDTNVPYYWLWIDVSLTLLAALACIETTVVLCLAFRRHSHSLYHVELQTWAVRVMIVGPVYSLLIIGSLWIPHFDFYFARPVGIVRATAGRTIKQLTGGVCIEYFTAILILNLVHAAQRTTITK